MSFKKLVVIFSSILFLALASGNLFADTQKCAPDSQIANGPFSYALVSGTPSGTFNGTDVAAFSFSFSVTAPNADATPAFFAGQGQNNGECLTQASATIGVLEITQIADASGNPVNNPIQSGSSLYNQIAGAFAVSPSTNIFNPGSSVTVGVNVGNPDVDPVNYGEYRVKLAAQAIGAGIGVGPGIEFDLQLNQPSSTCMTKPLVSFLAPTNNGHLVLGPVGITVQASGVCSPLVSLSATISSSGGTVSTVPISLYDSNSFATLLSNDLPAAAGVTVTGYGSYTPTGGSGTPGTTLVSSFTSLSRSGIGTYMITATATDAAGNVGTATDTFYANYNVSFTRNFVQPSCSATHTSSCSAQMAFTATRADGTFMFDQTVQVKLLDGATTLLTHPYGTGSINDVVQINSIAPTLPLWDYQTNFDGGSLTFKAYTVEAFFLDVDGNLIEAGQPGQGSIGVTF